MLLRARVVLPISQPPIENGAVRIAGRRIVAVGRWSDLAKHEAQGVTDLGESVLLPGLINAHCHLDYTDLVGHIPPPARFTDWIKAMVALKAAWSYSDFAQSWLRGANMLLRSGVTTVADVEAVPELIPDMWWATPLKVISFREIIGLKTAPSASEIVKMAVQQWSVLPEGSGRVGLSPHAPYTTSTELLQLAARAARKHHWPLTTHVAESEPEFEMFKYGQGQLYQWLKSQRDMSDCGLRSPVQHLERAGYLDENLLAVHVNYLEHGDALLLGQRGVSVVHCPRSHAYFRHAPFPRESLAAAGVNICLGTDSLVSVLPTRRVTAKLDLFAEMQSLHVAVPHLSPLAILKMATIHGAKALGRGGEIGELTPHALADLINVSFAGRISDACDAVLHHAGDVRASMIDGQWVILPNQ